MPDLRTVSKADAAVRGHRAQRTEVIVVSGLLAALLALVFGGYYAGELTPPWDFLGSYNTEAYAWWDNGSFFAPADWIPNAWGGYPAAASIQNSAWYLPVGLFAWLTPYTIHASAILSTLHYAFGALGVYVLGRRFDLGRTASTLGLVGFFFVSGFFAQAEYVDIARGYAWLPWLFLIASTRWPWHRWWSIPVAAIAIWQAVLTTYPGMIVAGVYCLGAWVLVQQLHARPRPTSFLAPLAIAGAIAAALIAVKYVPALLLDSGGEPSQPDASELTLGVLLTAFLPYGNDLLVAGDIAMRSFFIPATCLLLVPLARFRSTVGAASVAVLTVATALGLPAFPWHDAVSLLPGMDMSRFRMSDFRGFMLLAACILSMTAVARLRAGEPLGRLQGRLSALAYVSWLVVLPIAAEFVGFDASEWVVPYAIGAVAIAVAWVAALHLPRSLVSLRASGALTATALVGLTLISGVVGAFGTQAPWRAGRVFAETESYGATVDELLADGAGAEEDTAQRPPREPMPSGLTEAEMMDPAWNAGYYAEFDTVGGYVNLKRSPSFRELRTALGDPLRFDETNAFFAAPGIIAALDGDGSLPDPAAVTECVDTGACGTGITTEPLSYEPGRLSYRATLTEPTTVVLNESYYPGWHVRAAGADGSDTVELAATRGPAGAIAVAVPAGSWEIDAVYVPPGSGKAWIAFACGAAAVVLVGPLRIVVARLRRARRSSTGSRPANDSGPAADRRAAEDVSAR